jgi:dolichol kinase
MEYSSTEIALVTGLLVIWNLAVIQVVSKLFYGWVRRFQDVPAEYVGRKVVHILGGGVTTLLVPVFYDGHYWVVALAALVLAGYVQIRRMWRPMHWFQVEENAYEVHFAVSYGGILVLGILLGDVWIGLVPMLFMSFGDSVTGLVRAFRQRRQVKSWDGTIAMFAVCSIIGFWVFGWFGVLLGAVASLVERIPGVDDNITIPLACALLVFLRPQIPIP